MEQIVILNSQQIKTYFVRFLQPIHLNWRSYNFLNQFIMYEIYLIYMSSEYVLILF